MWNDALGGFLYGGFVSRVLIWHGTFSINSFAHWLGDQQYSILNTSRGNLFLAFLTCGEGLHNFHHEFPYDYRNGIKFFSYDPTKWCIYLMNKLGLAYNLVRASDSDIQKSELVTKMKKIESEKSKFKWLKTNLPSMSRQQLDLEVKNGRKLFIIEGFVVDFESFVHPGGLQILNKNIGKDVTSLFNGESNIHTMTARLKMDLMKIAHFVE